MFKPKCYPVHTLSNQLPQPVRENLLRFHALTGCDSVIIQWMWQQDMLENHKSDIFFV